MLCSYLKAYSELPRKLLHCWVEGSGEKCNEALMKATEPRIRLAAKECPERPPEGLEPSPLNTHLGVESMGVESMQRWDGGSMHSCGALVTV